MFFLRKMPFSYFFLHTYPGYFLQALPVALLAGAIYVRVQKSRGVPVTLPKWLLVCYLTGLFCLVIGLDLMGILWYWLLYQRDPGRAIGWFSGEIDLIPDVFCGINGEMVGNVLMFLPFGILYPQARENPGWKDTVLTGIALVLLIETIQPVVGRAFDSKDVLLNTMGVLLSATAFFRRRRR